MLQGLRHFLPYEVRALELGRHDRARTLKDRPHIAAELHRGPGVDCKTVAHTSPPVGGGLQAAHKAPLWPEETRFLTEPEETRLFAEFPDCSAVHSGAAMLASSPSRQQRIRVAEPGQPSTGDSSSARRTATASSCVATTTCSGRASRMNARRVATKPARLGASTLEPGDQHLPADLGFL